MAFIFSYKYTLYQGKLARLQNPVIRVVKIVQDIKRTFDRAYL